MSTIFDTVPRKDSLRFWRGGELDGRKVTDFLQFSTQDVSRIAQVAKASVRFDSRMPPQVEERLALIANICNLVFEHFDDQAKTALWFKTPNPLLGNVSPRDMIRYGRYHKLLRFVTEALQAGSRREQAKEKAAAQEAQTSLPI